MEEELILDDPARDSLAGSTRQDQVLGSLDTPTVKEKARASFETFVPGMASLNSKGSIFSPDYYLSEKDLDKSSDEFKKYVMSVPTEDRQNVYNQNSTYAAKLASESINTKRDADKVIAKMGIAETILAATLTMPFDPTTYVFGGAYSKISAARKIAGTSRKMTVAHDALLGATEAATSEALVQAYSTKDGGDVAIAFGTAGILAGGASGIGNLIGHMSAPSMVKKKLVQDMETQPASTKPTTTDEIEYVDEVNAINTNNINPDSIEIDVSKTAKVINAVFGWKFTLSPGAQIQKLFYGSKKGTDGHTSKAIAQVEAMKYDTQTFGVTDSTGRQDLTSPDNVSDIQYNLAGIIGQSDMDLTIAYRKRLEEWEVDKNGPKPSRFDFEVEVESVRSQLALKYETAKVTNRNIIVEDVKQMESIKQSVEKELYDTEVLPDGTVEYVDKHMEKIAPYKDQKIIDQAYDGKQTMDIEAEKIAAEQAGVSIKTEPEIEKTKAQLDYEDVVREQEIDKLARDATPNSDISHLSEPMMDAITGINRYSYDMAEQAKLAGMDKRSSWDPEMYSHRMYDKDAIANVEYTKVVDDFTEAILTGPRSQAEGKYIEVDYNSVKSFPDGRLAQNNNGKIDILENVSAQDIINYMRFDKRTKSITKTFTKEQKRYVNEYMKNTMGIDLDAELRGLSDAEAKEFLALHEKRHDAQRDKYGDDYTKEYYSGDRSLAEGGNAENKFLSKRAIEFEADANRQALKDLKKNMAARLAAKKEAQTIVNNINNSGSLRDIMFPQTASTKAPLKRRSLSLNTDKIAPYLNTNGSEVRQGYHYQMKGEISTNKMFNTSKVEEYMKNLDPRIVGEERKLLETMFETALGSRQIPSDPGAAYRSITRDLKTWNYLTDAGGFAKYAVSELGVAGAKLGFNNVMREMPAAAKMVSDMYSLKDINANTPEAIRTREIIRMSEAYEIYSNKNRSALGDTSDLDTMMKSGYDSRLANRVSQSMRGMQETMFKLSGLEAATVFSKLILPRAFMGRLFDNIAAGKDVSKSLKRWGITKQDMEGLKAILDKNGWDKNKLQDFAFDKWEDQVLAHKIQMVTGRMSRDVILRHESLRIPSWMTDGDGSAILDLTKQFMSFNMMSYDKLLLAGMNDNKAMAATGMIASGAILGLFATMQEKLLVAAGVKNEEDAILPTNGNAAKFFRQLAVRQSYASLPGSAMELAGFSDWDGGAFMGNYTTGTRDMSKFIGGPSLNKASNLIGHGSKFLGDPSIEEGLNIAKAVAPMNNLIWYDWAVKAGIKATAND